MCKITGNNRLGSAGPLDGVSRETGSEAGLSRHVELRCVCCVRFLYRNLFASLLHGFLKKKKKKKKIMIDWWAWLASGMFDNG